MTRPIVHIIDVTTQEAISREMNDEEFAQYEADQMAAATVEETDNE
jgi:hypothetical protein